MLTVIAASTAWCLPAWGWAGGSTAISSQPEAPDVLEEAVPWAWAWLRDRLYIDEFYAVTVIAFYAWWARLADWLDRSVWGGVVAGVAWLFRGWADFNRFLDNNWVDGSFDKGCEELRAAEGCCRAYKTAACKPI